MNTELWIEKLRKLGLNGYEARVYLALLGEDRAPVSRIVAKSRVPQSKVYATLASLAERGFAEQVLGEIKLYRGVQPLRAFENHRRNVESGLDCSFGDMEKLADSVLIENRTDPTALLLHQRGELPAVPSEIRSELLIASRRPKPDTLDLERHRRLRESGVFVRVLLDASCISDPARSPQIVQYIREFSGVRFMDALPVAYSIVDGQLTSIELVSLDGGTRGLLVPDAGLAAGLRQYFDSCWHAGKTLEEVMPEEAALRG